MKHVVLLLSARSTAHAILHFHTPCLTPYRPSSPVHHRPPQVSLLCGSTGAVCLNLNTIDLISFVDEHDEPDTGAKTNLLSRLAKCLEGLRTRQHSLMFTGGSTLAEQLGRSKLAAAGCLLMVSRLRVQ
jgi:hypothetical protein